ncbi:MAG: MATE family efflux transporter [Lachnospira sp.]
MNKQNIEIFANAPVPKAVLTNVLPSMVSMLMVLLYNLADTFFIGQTKNALMVAAVSLATPAFLIFMAVGMLFGIGGTSLISRRLGEGKDKDAGYASSFCFWTGIVIGIVAMIFIFSFSSDVARLVGASDDTVDLTSEYLRIVSTSIPFLIFSNTFSSIIRAEGRAKTAMTGMIIGNVVNIVLDPVLILGAGLNVAGAAIATVIGNASSSIFYLIYLLSKKTHLSIKPSDYKPGKGIAVGVLAIGIPASLNSVLMSVSNILLNNIMAEYNDMAVAGLGVAMKVNMIVVMLLIGLGTGVQPLLGYCFGAGNIKRYMAVLKFSMALAFSISIVMTVICYVFAGPLVTAFLDNDAAFTYGMTFSRIYILSGPIIGLLFVLMNAIQSTGAALPALILSVSRQGLLFIPVLFTLHAIFDEANVVAMSQPITDYLAVSLALVLFIVTYHKYISKIGKQVNKQ